jgi:hypothetical protein
MILVLKKRTAGLLWFEKQQSKREEEREAVPSPAGYENSVACFSKTGPTNFTKLGTILVWAAYSSMHGRVLFFGGRRLILGWAVYYSVYDQSRDGGQRTLPCGRVFFWERGCHVGGRCPYFSDEGTADEAIGGQRTPP